MTIAANKTITPAPDAPASTIDRADDARHDRRVWLISVGIVTAMFLLLENPFWVPGGDSEVYIAAARNIALGNGYMFNGQPAKIAPPGWPMVLAFVMKFISPTFLALKLVTLTCMVGALATFYRVLRRFAPPMLCGAIIVLTALISHIYSLTFWLHSDALFTLITALTLLLALQISEGDRSIWRIVVLLLLCFAGAAVRYAGIINIVIVAAALLQGRIKPQNDRVWVTTGLAVAMTLGSFVFVREAVNYFAPERVAYDASAQIDPTAVLNDLAMTGPESAPTDILNTAGGGRSGYGTRILGYGTWFSYLLWQPLRPGTGSHAIWYVATAIGWIVVLIALPAVIEGIRKRQWLLPATALYTLALCLNWPQATARYLVPITPLFLLLIVNGLKFLMTRPLLKVRSAPGFPIDSDGATNEPRALQSAGFGWQRGFFKGVAIVGLGSVVLCNLVLYGEEVRIMRSRHFADRYEAGLNKGLVAAAQYLSKVNVGHWQTAINPEYINIGKRRMSPTGLRILTMLTGKAALQLPKKWTEAPYKPPNDREFRKNFIGKHRVAFYLEQPKISPWRVSHYRMAWLQEWLTGEPVQEIEAGWRLYRCDGASTPVRVPLPENVEFPRRVAGM